MARARRTPEEAAAAREAKLDQMAEKLESAVEALTTGEDWARAMTFAARFRSRSFRNSLLIYAQHLDAYEQGRVPEPMPTYVAGFQQWKQLGRSVEKGQSGYMIYAPVMGRFASANPSNPESWRRLVPREKPKPGEVVRSKILNVKPAYVWDASQTSGVDLPERPAPRLLEGQAPAGLWGGLAAQIEARGFAVLHVAHAGLIGGANGRTDFTARTVAVRADVDDLQQVKTLSHELGHIALGHEESLGAAGWHRGIGEVEAESVAMMIGAAWGVDSSAYTIPYVASWANSVLDRTPVEVVRETGERVRKTALAILEQLPDAGIGDGYPPGLTPDTTERDSTGREQGIEPAERARRLSTAEPVAALEAADAVAVAR